MQDCFSCLFQLSLDKAERECVGLCARLFQLSLDKAARECVGCIQRDCFSCLPIKMNVNVLFFWCETVSAVTRQGCT